MKYILYAVAVILAIDFIGFMAWAISGQYPIDGFFIGRITAEVVRFIF